ncbi:MAG: PorT family protein [Bacteroidetes bacterium]|nr:PorT family protein [Bacteroidota bacterium]
MKRLIIIIFCLLTINVVAQKNKVLNKPKYDNYLYHFGFAIGFNTMDFTIHKAGNFLNANAKSYIDKNLEYPDNQKYSIHSIENIRRPGFNINVVTNLRINEDWDLRFTPGLCFGQRDLDYLVIRIDTVALPNETYTYHHMMSLESTFLQFPVYLKYRAKRINNYRPYIIGGMNYSYDLAIKIKSDNDDDQKIALNHSDFYLEMGFGIDYYLTFFKLSSEIKFSMGVNDVLKHDKSGYTKSIDKINSKIISLIFYFE